MIRKIISIDEDKCNGCGACASACHEGAIGMVNGKARLLREDYCDGLGDCLPACPTGAITFEEREAPAYDHAAVLRAQAEKNKARQSGCPGTAAKAIVRTGENTPCAAPIASRLSNWPVQLKLAPIASPYFNDAHLLIAADCTAFAYGSFHDRFLKGRTALIGCPKLDSVDYSMKLAQIFAANRIQSVTVVRMEVPCCGGIEFAVRRALEACGKDIPCRVVTISTDGNILP